MNVRSSVMALIALGVLGWTSIQQASAQVVTIEEAFRYFPGGFSCNIEGWMTRMPDPQAVDVNRSMYYREVGATNWRFGGNVSTTDYGHPTLLYYYYAGPPPFPPYLQEHQDVEVAIVLEWLVDDEWHTWFNTVTFPGQP